MDLETEAKLRFLNHKDPRAQLLTNLEDDSFANLYGNVVRSIVHDN